MPLKPSAKFIYWLNEFLASSAPRTVLAPVPVLSSHFNLSQKSIRRILTRFRDEGKIVSIPGRGSFTPWEISKVPDGKDSTGQSEHIIVDFILSAMARGEIRTGDPLPPIKFLKSRFHVAGSTVTAAYRTLEKERHVVRFGKSYWAGTYRTLVKTPSRREILFIDSCDSDVERLFADYFLAPAFRTMERELLEYGFYLRVYRNAEGKGSRLLKGISSNPHGILFASMTEERYALLKPEIRALLGKPSEKRPRIVFEGAVLRAVPAAIKLFCIGNQYTHRARTLARYIRDRQFKNVTVFYDQGEYPEAGFYFGYYRIFTELQPLGMEVDFKLVVKPNPGQSSKQFITEAYGTRSMEDFVAIFSKYRKTAYTDPIEKSEFTHDFREVFSKQRCRGIWIFSGDVAAAEALDWCQSHGIEVPETLQIISYKNSPKFITRGISCCSNDYDRIGYMLAHALIGDVPLETTRKGFLSAPVCLYHRLTSAPPGA